MLWGLIMQSQKKYSLTVGQPFLLSQAVLDIAESNVGVVQVVVTMEGTKYLLCNLCKNRPHVALNAYFEKGDQISITVKGKGTVHLSGFLVPSDDMIDGKNGNDPKQDPIDKAVGKKVNAKEVQLEKGDVNEQGQATSDENDDMFDDDDDDDWEPPKAKIAKKKPSKQNRAKNGKASSKEPGIGKNLTGKKRTLQGVLVVDNVKAGEGARAKSGWKLALGLRKNNKVFESASGQGLKFALGRGENLDVDGMNVGGNPSQSADRYDQQHARV